MRSVNKELFKKAFDYFVPLSDEEWNVLSGYIKQRTFKKGEYLCEIGQVEDYLSIIDTGTCRGFYRGAKEEVSVVFMFDGDYSCAYYSFIANKPSLMALQAMTPTTIVSIHRDDLQRFADKYKSGERIGRLNAERAYRRKEEREVSLLIKSATERYIELINQYPKVLQHIPLKHVASYLGVKPESLSRIRKQLSSA